MRKILLLLTSLLIVSCVTNPKAHSFEDGLSNEKVLFPLGSKGYENRLVMGPFQPTLASDENGTLFAFAQGRLGSSSDKSDKVLMFRYSEDQGQSWSEITNFLEPGVFFGLSAFSVEAKQCSVVYSYNKNLLQQLYSDKEIEDKFNIRMDRLSPLASTILYQVNTYKNGSQYENFILKEDFIGKEDINGRIVTSFTPIGQAHFVKEGKNNGRIIIGGTTASIDKKDKAQYLSLLNRPSDDTFLKSDIILRSGSFMYSDNNGGSWKLSSVTTTTSEESSAVTINNGKDVLMISRRDPSSIQEKRVLNISYDWGKTWTVNGTVDTIPSPRCFGPLYRDSDKILFTTPAVPQPGPRKKGTVSISTDEGKTWENKMLEKNGFSYSSIVKITGTDTYAVAYSKAYHGELGLWIKFFKEDWLN